MRWLLLFFLACAEQQAPVALYRVSGRVRTSVGPALVTLDNLLVTPTNEFGDFKFDNVPSGRYTVTVQSLVPTLEGVVVRGIDVQDGDISSLLFDLTPVGRVFGFVTDDSGRPIGGARVFAAGTAAVTFSAADGSFSLDNVPLGERIIVAQSNGFAPDRTALAVLPGETEILLILAFDDSVDMRVPNQIPVINALSFAPKDNSADNPRAIPIAGQTQLVHPQSTLTLTVSAADPEGTPLTYLWSADKGALSGTGATVEWTATNAAAEVVVVVVDADGGSTTARQRFSPPSRSIRGAAIYGHEIFYSESRESDDRDIVGFNLDSGVERAMYAAIEEQHAPRVVGDVLVFADQVFTFVQANVFRVRMLGMGPKTGLNLTVGQTLTPSDSFLIDYRLYAPPTAARFTYFSQSSQLAPLGIGSFDPVAGTYAQFSGSPTPAYPCFVPGFGVQGHTLYRYPGGVAVADLPGTACLDMQAANGRVALRMNDDRLTVVNAATGAQQSLGMRVGSFYLYGDMLAYTDNRGGVTGVYLRNLSTAVDRTVAATGFFDRRILDLNAELLVYGQSQETGNISNYSSESLHVFRLQ